MREGWCIFKKRGPRTLAANVLLKVADLREGGILTAGAEEITKAVDGDTTSASLVEQGEGLLVVGRSLRIELVRRHLARQKIAIDPKYSARRVGAWAVPGAKSTVEENH